MIEPIITERNLDYKAMWERLRNEFSVMKYSHETMTSYFSFVLLGYMDFIEEIQKWEATARELPQQ